MKLIATPTPTVFTTSLKAQRDLSGPSKCLLLRNCGSTRSQAEMSQIHPAANGARSSRIPGGRLASISNHYSCSAAKLFPVARDRAGVPRTRIITSARGGRRNYPWGQPTTESAPQSRPIVRLFLTESSRRLRRQCAGLRAATARPSSPADEGPVYGDASTGIQRRCQ